MTNWIDVDEYSKIDINIIWRYLLEQEEQQWSKDLVYIYLYKLHISYLVKVFEIGLGVLIRIFLILPICYDKYKI